MHSNFEEKILYRGAKGEHYHHILHIKNAIGFFSFDKISSFPQNAVIPAIVIG